MNLDLADRLRKRLEDSNPVKIGIIGLGKFATMFLSQARLIKGFQITALADLDYKRANDALITAGYDPNITVNNIDLYLLSILILQLIQSVLKLHQNNFHQLQKIFRKY